MKTTKEPENLANALKKLSKENLSNLVSLLMVAHENYRNVFSLVFMINKGVSFFSLNIIAYSLQTPHWLLVFLSYSHPPLMDRLSAIRDYGLKYCKKDTENL